MEFPSAGDLWVISNLYPDATVAALEELIGSHGGVGGPQTDAFIFQPPRIEVPETRCSIDVFPVLNGYRPGGGSGQAVAASTHPPPTAE